MSDTFETPFEGRGGRRLEYHRSYHKKAMVVSYRLPTGYCDHCAISDQWPFGHLRRSNQQILGCSLWSRYAILWSAAIEHIRL